MKHIKTSSEEIIEKRYRHFMILLYPEWKNFQEILTDIKTSFKNYAYIKHKREEEEKKEHYHLILSLDNPRSLESVSKRLNIPINLIQNIKSLRGACRYLIHMDLDDKIQYELNSVIVSKSFKNTFFRSFDDLLSDDEILSSIYDYISASDQTGLDLEISLSLKVCQCGWERVFKRYYNTITKLCYTKKD